ncbi:DUF2267 domain-containing protein [Rhodobacteraceae bacterium HSP-20]|uniref:DUF2267 domain-containing protein n=1 Tax=Paragemmobacter amnigenus TaxID=2852097 RepID=A0ABS6IYL0_9RHOB|nr:DUF2267 domain-containing protein [Rhodobacter amnigenus]MBU9696604.1 DUF2267 domain-containing protein [Rhodobacter amnigenus]MBV4387831.1 DUF2267 domain-containing protein [Rhodobacter amnigenus]
MKQTGLDAIDHAPQVVAEWLNLLEEDLGWTDRSRSYRLLRETLHAIRDFLTVQEAASLSAQLPLLVRGIFFEGWMPARTPARPRSAEALLERVNGAFGDEPLLEPDVAIAAVFSVLRRRIDSGEYDQVARSLRRPLRELWM